MTTFSYAYDNSHDPALPVITVRLSTTEGGNTKTRKFNAIIDSGADGTLIPLTDLQILGVPIARKARLRGITGNSIWVNVYVVALNIGPIPLAGVRVIASPSDEAILGRNVLNQLRITLDGPAEMTELELSP
jgi:predicted aspartyl protease